MTAACLRQQSLPLATFQSQRPQPLNAAQVHFTVAHMPTDAAACLREAWGHMYCSSLEASLSCCIGDGWGTQLAAHHAAQPVMIGMMVVLSAVGVMCSLECAHVNNQGLVMVLLMDQGHKLTAACSLVCNRLLLLQVPRLMSWPRMQAPPAGPWRGQPRCLGLRGWTQEPAPRRQAAQQGAAWAQRSP